MLYDYKMAGQIERIGYPFYSLIMAAMKQADTDNLKKLQDAFPDTWRELVARYNAPNGGELESDKDDTALVLIYDPDADATGESEG